MKVFLDTETTGVEIGACVIELAAILVDEEDNIVDTFHEYAYPYRDISSGAYAAHGLTKSFLSGYPEEKVMLKHFMEWFIGSGVDQVFAYNAQFDIRVIKDRIIMDSLMSDNIFANVEVIDVASYAKTAIKNGVIPKQGRKWSQEYIANCLGIEYNAHSAIEDVKAMMQIYNKLVKVI